MPLLKKADVLDAVDVVGTLSADNGLTTLSILSWLNSSYVACKTSDGERSDSMDLAYIYSRRTM